MAKKIGISVTLATSAARYEDGNAHSTPVDTKYVTEGIFVLEASQGAGTYTNETLDVDIEVYDALTDDWYVLTSFTQITDATTPQRELKKVQYGLGKQISCKWAIANAVVGEAYTFTVSGTVK